MDAKNHYLPRIAVAMLMVALPLFNRNHDQVQPAQAAVLPPTAAPLAATVSPPPAAVNVVQALAPTPTAANDRLPTQPLDSMRITSNFGSRFHPILHRIQNHDGVDLAAHLNDPIHAVYDGTVTSAGWRGGYGNAVEIYHASLHKTTLYGHMNAIEVRTGQRVAEGQVIGLAGTTGLSTGVHLHFGVENRGGGWTSPMAFLDGLTEAPASTMIATTPVSPRSYAPSRSIAPVKHQTSSARVIARAKSTRSSAVIASAKHSSPISSSRVATSHITSSQVVATRAASVSAPKVAVVPAAPKRNVSELKDRFTAAAQAAETYSKLYDEGAVSRVDRDSRVATAKQLQAQLQTPD
jgi:hypothetical protein